MNTRLVLTLTGDSAEINAGPDGDLITLDLCELRSIELFHGDKPPVEPISRETLQVLRDTYPDPTPGE